MEVTTTKRKNTQHPVFKEEFKQEYEASDERKPGLMEVIVEHNKKVLGAGILPLSGVRREFRLKQWLTLKDPETKNASGSICLIGCWRHNPALVFDPFGGPVIHKDRLQNELQISVYRCRCLPLRENGNEPSPSVSVALGMAPAVNTDKKKAQAAPTFKNNFAFNVEVGDPVDCDITVYDHQTISKKVIGIVKLRDLTQGLSNRLPFRKWYPLESKDAQYVERPLIDPPRAPGEEARKEDAPLGQVQLLFRWRHNPACEPQLLGDLMDTPAKEANELLVLVGRARDLRPSRLEIPDEIKIKDSMFGNSTEEGKMRAFLQASYVIDEESTSINTRLQKGTYGPRWFELLRIGLHEHAVDTDEVSDLEIEIRDRIVRGTDGNQPILGSITLNLREALKQRRKHADQELPAPDWRWHSLIKPEVPVKKLAFNEEPPPDPLASLKIAYLFRHDPDRAPEYYTGPDLFPAEEPNELRLAIVAARNLGKRPDLLIYQRPKTPPKLEEGARVEFEGKEGLVIQAPDTKGGWWKIRLRWRGQA